MFFFARHDINHKDISGFAQILWDFGQKKPKSTNLYYAFVTEATDATGQGILYLQITWQLMAVLKKTDCQIKKIGIKPKIFKKNFLFKHQCHYFLDVATDSFTRFVIDAGRPVRWPIFSLAIGRAVVICFAIAAQFHPRFRRWCPPGTSIVRTHIHDLQCHRVVKKKEFKKR